MLFILYFIYRPIPLQALYNRYYYPSSIFEDGEYTQQSRNTYKKLNYNSYLLKNSGANTLIVWFHGGCFIQENPDIVLPFLGLLRQNMPNCDILTFDYPLPYSRTLDDTIVCSNQIIAKYIGNYDNYYVAGDSAGSLLALLTTHIETSPTLSSRFGINPLGVKFNGYISVCGFYDIRFNGNALAEMIFKFYIGRGTKNWNNFLASEILVPALVFTSKSDFLYKQNIDFVQRNLSRDIYLKEFDTHNSIHCFISHTGAEETKEAVQYIKMFVSDKNH